MTQEEIAMLISDAETLAANVLNYVGTNFSDEETLRGTLIRSSRSIQDKCRRYRESGQEREVKDEGRNS